MTITRAVLLAAGKGTRMQSDLPKVLHPILGRAMILFSVDTVKEVTGHPPVVVVGHGADEVRRVVGGQAEYVEQSPQLGTAHAVQQAEAVLSGRADLVLITSGDMPLLTATTLKELVYRQAGNDGPLSLLTVLVDNPRGFGRILRGADGNVIGIVEEKVASPEQLAIRELNVGAYCVSAEWLWDALCKIQLSPVGEYYLTDLVAVAVAQNKKVLAFRVDDPDEAIGINTPTHLRDAEVILKNRMASAAQVPGKSS